MRKIRVLDNVYDLITINMEDCFKDNVAFRFYDTANDAVTTILYKDYVQDIRKAVNYFQSTIPEIKGKKICLLTKNSYEYAVNTFGVVAAGAVLVLLNQRKSWDELSYELGLVEPDAILTDGDDYGFNDQLKAAYGDILRPMDGFRSYEPAQLTRCIDHEALMVLMFTSGTTGRSKGVMLSEKNFFSVMRAHTQIGEHMMAYKPSPHRQRGCGSAGPRGRARPCAQRWNPSWRPCTRRHRNWRFPTLQPPPPMHWIRWAAGR